MEVSAEVSANIFFPIPEYRAMDQFYLSANGSKWIFNGIPWNFSSYHNPCTEKWQGIACVSIPKNQSAQELKDYFPSITKPNIYTVNYVTSLSLVSMQLSGIISSSIGIFTFHFMS